MYIYIYIYIYVAYIYNIIIYYINSMKFRHFPNFFFFFSWGPEAPLYAI